MLNKESRDKFKVGDKVRAIGNYEDEQQGHYADTTSIRTVTEVKDTSALESTTGQWIKTDTNEEWVDSAWFGMVESKENGWEERFDTQFTSHNLRDDLSEQKVSQYIKAFIHSVIAEERKKEREKLLDDLRIFKSRIESGLSYEDRFVFNVFYKSLLSNLNK